VTPWLENQLSLAFAGEATMLYRNSGHPEADPCHFLMN
jgi:hypothetical protein